MERETITEVEGDEDQCGISELPLDMMEEIFGKLSIKQISGCRIVSKEWNSILSSQSFLSSLPPENPWLLMCGLEEDERNWQYMAYCFSTQKWRTISLSFLPNQEGGSNRYISTTAQGLLLFREVQGFGETARQQLCVCNPLVRSYAEIKIDATGKSIYLVKGTKGEPYLVLCWNLNSVSISFQIYHYFQDSWRIKLQFVGETGTYMLGHRMVECNGTPFFWRGLLDTAIVGYNIQDGFINPVRVSPLPLEVGQGRDRDVHSMIAYGSSVLMVEAITQSKQTGIIIWELFQDEEDKLLWKWKEFARMPPLQNLPEYIDTYWWHRECVCVGDYLCFSSLFGRESVLCMHII